MPAPAPAPRPRATPQQPACSDGAVQPHAVRGQSRAPRTRRREAATRLAPPRPIAARLLPRQPRARQPQQPWQPLSCLASREPLAAARFVALHRSLTHPHRRPP
eukprot:2479366-Prymnesium_polylepis.1